MKVDTIPRTSREIIAITEHLQDLRVDFLPFPDSGIVPDVTT